jgi:hypothetical protein
MKDLLIEFVLQMFDGVVDVFTLGAWSRWQGSRIPNLKVKGK